MRYYLPTNISEVKTTDLCEIMGRHGSDKGSLETSQHHNYTKTVYHPLLSKFRQEKFNMLEMGIGTINPAIPSSMAGKPGGYTPGASLRGWKEYFPNATIYGADIDTDILFHEDRIKTFFMDMTKPSSIQNVIDMGIQYRLIIDDAMHYFPTNFTAMQQLYSILEPGGIYIIEDIMNIHYDSSVETCDFLNSVTESGGKWDYVIIPNPCNVHDNNLFVIQKSELPLVANESTQVISSFKHLPK